jgi:hypothetical protein
MILLGLELERLASDSDCIGANKKARHGRALERFALRQSAQAA